MDLPGWAQIVIAAAALLGAWQVIWKRGLVPLYTAARIWEQVADEFRPNGGHSLKDTVNRIDEKVAVIEQRWDERAGLLDDLHRKVDAHLALPQWAAERDEVLLRLTKIVESQALMVAAVIDVLGQESSPLARKVTETLQVALESARN